jgi:preprotein translocase subunit SecA
VRRVPLRLPSRREVLPTRVFGSHDARWRFVVQRATEIHAASGAVLIGTDSVADSQALSGRLHAAGLAHVVLNARQDRHEAEVVARAGQQGTITVATSMAGRGTDIELGEKLAQGRGLHVILCQANASRRIDRQFIGRSARRGEPGSCETLLSLESEAIASRLPSWVLRLTREELRPRALALLLARFPLWLEGRLQRRMRKHLRAQDRALERQPIFGADGA